MKELKRTVIIREYDYDKLCKLYHIGPDGLYTSATFEPYLRKHLEQDHIVRTLSDRPRMNSYGLPRRAPTGDVYRLLSDDPLRLYNRRYLHYILEEDGEGRIWCQARSNTPKSILGLAEFKYVY